ncbi:hypothetical protein phiPsa397_029 [Pseudomonas phage phiPsa397]|uniref:Uncharacterized protein n=1 Tax=Pseudomonas phage phiPsa397 TaxID=1460367 RepID=A0A7G9V398_9CAUD|nr:hypothetical protein QGX16_gp029 [Pseudomonas phage phiPsa397]QNO00754.1 hypothetical protein phiPsa397_029 [Pseudomonas phage phiPsa397]
MKTFKALAVALLMMTTVVGVVDAKSRVSSRSSYSAPKMSASKVSAPKPSSNQKLKDMGFTKPASIPTVSNRSVPVSSNVYKSAPTKTTTTSGGWFTQKKVSSTPAPKPVYARKVSSPTAYKTSYRPKQVVIQRNYYNYGGYNGYNRGYGGRYYGNGYGYNSGGSGFGSSLMGAFAGMMIYDALTDSSAEKALQAQVNALTANQQATNNALLMMNQAPVAKPQVEPQCYLPEDAPLMMNPKFYCEQPK